MQGSQQIQQIVDAAVVNIKQVAQSNTVIGQPLVTAEGATVIPLTEVTFAFVVGGGEYGEKKKPTAQFAGGSGGGATLSPVGFLVVDNYGVKIVRIDEQNSFSRLIDAATDIVKGLQS